MASVFSALRSRSCNSFSRPDRSLVARRAAAACDCLGFGEIGIRDCVGEHRRLGRFVGPDVDVDDEGAVGLLHIDVADERLQRAPSRRPSLLRLGGISIPNRPSSEATSPLELAAAEFRILVQMGVVDHLQQHVVGGDQPRLAFDHHREAGDVLRRAASVRARPAAVRADRHRAGRSRCISGVRLLPIATATQAQISAAETIATLRRHKSWQDQAR